MNEMPLYLLLSNTRWPELRPGRIRSILKLSSLGQDSIETVKWSLGKNLDLRRGREPKAVDLSVRVKMHVAREAAVDLGA